VLVCCIAARCRGPFSAPAFLTPLSLTHPPASHDTPLLSFLPPVILLAVLAFPPCLRLQIKLDRLFDKGYLRKSEIDTVLLEDIESEWGGCCGGVGCVCVEMRRIGLR
jgi:hypothetical protein